MIFVDANIIVKAFTTNKDSDKCQAVLREEFVTNSLALIEAQRNIEKIRKDRVYASQTIKSLFGRCIIRSLDKNLIFESIKRIGLKLDFFDLIHYTTALTEGCEAIVSYDKDFNNLQIKRVEP